MSEDPLEIFDRLLVGKPGLRNRHHLSNSRDFYESDWTYEEMLAIEVQFAEAFRSVAARVQAKWGPPDFIGPRAKSQFPEFYVAEELCYWKKGDVLAIIWWEH
jgi:hypothetical protein